MNFDGWMAAVDAECERRYGVSVYDLADCPFHDWYDDGVSPKSAAVKARRMQG